MRRSDVLKMIESDITAMRMAPYDMQAASVLNLIEKLGMLPPCISAEDVQVTLSLYYGGYSLNRWDEDLEKDEKHQVEKERRRLAKEARDLKRNRK